ncbi:MAG: hypothetical protein H6Q37_2589 [Chloroflexi bacterium]|jgi:hypothetical protein|nr:hypothetical protein [Chloroflexota bacterium]
MEMQPIVENSSLMLDGNALAGLLQDVFATEMTVAPVECASCGREGEMGSLWAFTESPGYILRCPTCHNIILRMVVTPDKIYIDARGAAFLCIPTRIH